MRRVAGAFITAAVACVIAVGAAGTAPVHAETAPGLQVPFQFADSYAQVEADSEGKPRLECNQFHDGEKVKTVHEGKTRKFICMHHDPIFSSGYWVWTELLG